jgi:hypothetical protein
VTADSEAAIIANDLDSLLHRIEALQPHPKYTEAVSAVMQARLAINAGRQAIHQKAMGDRFAEMDR